MKIQNIQQNNNTNFKELYGSKRALKSLKHSPLKTEVEKLAKNCDVLVKKEADKFWTPLLTIAISSLSGIVTGLSMDSITSALSVGFVSSIVSLFSFGKIFKNNTIQLAENIKKNDRTNKFEIEGLKSQKILLSNEDDLADLEKSYITEVMHYGSDELKKQHVKRFVEIQLTKDKNGNLPIHKMKSTEEVLKLHSYLEYNKDDLAEIYLTRNNRGELPIHNTHIIQNIYFLEALTKIFKHYPRFLVTIFEAKNHEGESTIDVLQKQFANRYSGTVNVIMESIENAKKICVKKNGAFKPIVAKAEMKSVNTIEDVMNLEVDFKNIMNILRNKDVKKSEGYLLNNSNYIAKVIDFIINKASKEEENTIIKELEQIPSVDYNKLDDDNISVAEMVMNAENLELLELLEGKKLDYYPELDYAFERIENNDFKKQVKKLNFEFNDLELAVELKSMKGIKKLEWQLKSPLFKKEYNGKKLLDIINKEYGLYNYNCFSSDFIEKYGQCLSDYIV